MPEERKPLEGFEAGLKDLEAVVKELEGGELPLERAIELFEKGMALSAQCRKQLEQAETRVEQLIKKGNSVEAAPFGNDNE